MGGGLKRARRRRRRRRLGAGGVAITGAAAAAGAGAEFGATTEGAITDSVAGDGGEDAGAAVGATAAGGGGFDGDKSWPMECRIGKTCENGGRTGLISEASTEGVEAWRETTVGAVMEGGWAWTEVIGGGKSDEEEEEARMAATSSRSREFSTLSAATSSRCREFSTLSAATSRSSCCKVAVTSCPN